MDENKLEILVVEDKPENLEVAKKFYDTQNDIIFDYATNRKDAISMINAKKYDGVITDRTIPRDKDMKFPEEYSWIEAVCQSQGTDVLVYSVLKNIPVVVHTDHGGSSFYNISKETDQKFLEKMHELIEEATPFLEDKEKTRKVLTHGGCMHHIISQIKKLPGYEGMELKYGFGNSCEFSKKDTESWVMALNNLRQEIANYK